jgi:16S rRNA (adenine1518-N6/adenine1519-N6)-dimethyltransferase
VRGGARLGQHFLFDPAILGRIADAAVAAPDETVIEIGPGKGTLTRELAKRAARVTSIEMDRRLAADLAEAMAGTNVTVVQGDALEAAWPAADVIAGNIPYQITSPLIERALRAATEGRPCRRIVFLIQREVADRLAARPGEKAYGAMSAGVQLVADVELLFHVKAGSFKPPPKVESAVVRIVPRATPIAASPDEEARTRALIKALFQRRRNQIQRSIREYASDTGYRIPDTNALEAAGFNPMARAEELSPEAFVKLARLLSPA